MTINERLFTLRTSKEIDLNQEAFGSKINLSKFSISNYEIGKRDLPDRVITDICRVFNVSETWLRTGEGEMFVKTDDSLISKLSAEYDLSDTEKRVLSAYLRLDETRRAQLVDFISYFSNELVKSVSPEITATVAIRPAVNDRKLSRAEKEELMKRQLDAEEKVQTSSASTITNGLDGGKLA